MRDNINDANNINNEEEKDFDLALVIIPLIGLFICIGIILGVKGYIGFRNEQMQLQGLIDNLTVMANIRYTGYGDGYEATDSINKAITNSCTAEYAEQVVSQLSEAYSIGKTYDITEFVSGVTHKDSSRVLSDAITHDEMGNYYIDIEKLRESEPDGALKDSYDLECYDATYHFDTALLPYDPSTLVGNEDYNFSLVSYVENEDNTLDVTFTSKALTFETKIQLNSESLIELMTLEDFINDEV